jgi:hypothetical protein
MRENCLYGSEGGEAKAFPTPIHKSRGFGVIESLSACGYAQAGEASKNDTSKRISNIEQGILNVEG